MASQSKTWDICVFKTMYKAKLMMLEKAEKYRSKKGSIANSKKKRKQMERKRRGMAG